MKNEIFDIKYGSHERQKADIFMPDNPENASGIIFFIHGGGWHSGDKDDHHADCKHFCNLGYICATMNYRYVDKNTSVYDELDDITSALNTVKQECEKLGCTTEKVILSGASAGAHLALLYAYTRKNEAPLTISALCVWAPPVNLAASDFLLGISGEFEDWKYEILSKCCGEKLTKNDYLNEKQQAALKKISPSEYISENCVPTAVFHGRLDELIPFEHIEEFMMKLHNAGVENELLIYENSSHALDKDPETAEQARNIFEKYAKEYI